MRIPTTKKPLGLVIGLLLLQGYDTLGQNLFVNGSMSGTIGPNRTPSGWSINAFSPDINSTASGANIPISPSTAPYPWVGNEAASPDGGTFESTVSSLAIGSTNGGSEGFQQVVTGLIIGKQYRFRYYWTRTACVRTGGQLYNAPCRPNAVVTGMTGYSNPGNSNTTHWQWQTVDQVLTATATTATFNMRASPVNAPTGDNHYAGYISWDGFKLEAINGVPIAANDIVTGQTPGSPATVPNVLTNDTDPDGTLSPGNIRLMAPAGATGLTTDAQGDITGFTIPGQGAWSLNSSSGAVTFTPQSGFTGDPTPISYKVKDAAGAFSNAATITIDFNAGVMISGRVYNDNTGMSDGLTGPLMPGLTIVLYAADGITVITTTTTNANGSYSFSNQLPGSYVVGLTLPAGYQHVGSSDATPADGRITVTVGSGNVPDIHFAINQPPVAAHDSLSNQAPGNAATISGLLANDMDPNSGVLSPENISLIVPTGATGVTTDAQGDITGFTVPGQGAWSLNSSSSAVTFTPQNSFTGNPTPISYRVKDAAGLVSAPASISIRFTVPSENAAVTLIKDAAPHTGIPFGFSTSGGPVSLIDTFSGIVASDIAFTENGKLLITTGNGAVYTLANGANSWAEPAPGPGRLVFVDGGPGADRFIGSMASGGPVKITGNGGAGYMGVSGLNTFLSPANIDDTRFFALSDQGMLYYYDGAAYSPKAYDAARIDYFNHTVAGIHFFRDVFISQNTSLSNANDGTQTFISNTANANDIVIGPGVSPANPGLGLIYITTFPDGGVQYYSGIGDAPASWTALPPPPAPASAITTDPGGSPWIVMTDGRIAAWTGGPASVNGTWKVLQVSSSGPGNFVNYFQLPPGRFTITEDAPSGNYMLQSILHEGAGSAVTHIANRTDSLTLGDRDHAFETFTNQSISSPQHAMAPIGFFGNNAGQGLVLYPNPARTLLVIESKEEQMQHIIIYNTFGQTIYQAPVTEAHRTRLSTAAYAPGIYMIRIKTDKGEVTRNFEVLK
ncbi:T9SS type A sorting domain-containing protein [Taibaiella koreensis]|uniref:T9SS type A sorting domain-containing protein n=1 Tax=Taibaiella koreensis TaxID=1268548 RepID=UPI000E59AE76|nr:T9SS type A sorting domain-containing protein [Taibaiella koreensis]